MGEQLLRLGANVNARVKVGSCSFHFLGRRSEFYSKFARQCFIAQSLCILYVQQSNGTYDEQGWNSSLNAEMQVFRVLKTDDAHHCFATYTLKPAVTLSEVVTTLILWDCEAANATCLLASGNLILLVIVRTVAQSQVRDRNLYISRFLAYIAHRRKEAKWGIKQCNFMRVGSTLVYMW